MINLIILLALYFTGLAIAFFVGYRIGKRINQTVDITKIAADNFVSDWNKANNPFTIGGQKVNIEKNEVNPIAQKLSDKEDLINHDGVGIVLRPTSEELDRMNEDQQTREAKEAVAETFSQEKEPTI